MPAYAGMTGNSPQSSFQRRRESRTHCPDLLRGYLPSSSFFVLVNVLVNTCGSICKLLIQLFSKSVHCVSQAILFSASPTKRRLLLPARVSPSKQKTSIAVRIPRQPQSRSAYAASCLIHPASRLNEKSSKPLLSVPGAAIQPTIGSSQADSASRPKMAASRHICT